MLLSSESRVDLLSVPTMVKYFTDTTAFLMLTSTAAHFMFRFSLEPHFNGVSPACSRICPHLALRTLILSFVPLGAL